MNWQKEAKEDLRKYPHQKQSLGNMEDRLRALQSEYESIRCGMSGDSTPVKGGSSRVEDRMLNNIVARERLKYTYKATKRLVELVERGLAGLEDREQVVLERFFVHRRPGHVEQLMEEWHFEKTRVYEVKDEALYNFTVSMYGIIDY